LQAIQPAKACSRAWSGRGFAAPLRLASLVVVLLGFLTEAHAATWYVDSGATGANTGTSWTDAWAVLASASAASVRAGDTVYISGGPSGGTRTYSWTNSWVPRSGTAGSNITYQIGQDSAHNGTAIFNHAGNWPGTTTPSYCVLSGDAGDGKRHFSTVGTTVILNGGRCNGLRISYVDFGTITDPAYNHAAMYLSSVGSFEFDHNFLYLQGNTVDAALHVDAFQGTNYDQNLIHDNIVYVPTEPNSPIGADGLVMSGTGFSIYNNVLISYPNVNYSARQHADGWQTSGGMFIKIYNNLILGFGDFGLYGGCWGDAVAGGCHVFSNVRYYNNIVDSISNSAAGSIVVSSQKGTNSYFTNICVFNNLGRVGPASPNMPGVYKFRTGDGLGTWSDNYYSNNIAITPWLGVWNGMGFSDGNNVTVKDADAAALFVSFVAGATNNNFQLRSSATKLIRQGRNLYSAFPCDKDGVARPRSGNWDVGPYQTSAAPAAPRGLAIVISP
jgi:hypothetical protein